MSYMPLYGQVTDNQGGCAHTLCLRGKVDNVGFWLNSQFGSVMNVSANGGEYLTNYDRIQKCESRIKELSEDKKVAQGSEAKAAIQKKVDVWKEKLREAQGKEEELKKQNKVYVNINLHLPDKHSGEFVFNLNGICITQKQLEILQKHQEKDFLGMMGVVAAFGMIPDINRVVSGEEGAVEQFIDKKDRIEKFLKEEDEKIGELPPITLPSDRDE